MYPILFELGPFKIYSYGFSLAIAFIVATYLAKLEASRQGIAGEKILDLSLCIAISGILGARILYVLQNLEFYLENPVQILMLSRGGLSFYGGFILAAICANIFLKRKHLPFVKTFDIVIPYLALAQAIGRIGCFLNGCCYGKPTDFILRLYFPGQNIARHPVQIYNSLNLLLIFGILRIFQSKRRAVGYLSGQTFLLYCLLYSTMRFFMEYLRGDHLPVFVNLTIHQLISAGIFIISCLIWWKKWPFRLERWKNFA